MEEIEFSRWLFEGRPRQGKNVLPDGLNWLCYLAGSSKSHRENSISCIFLESPHQVDMKNVVKCYKQFFCYFNTLKTHCDMYFTTTHVKFMEQNYFNWTQVYEFLFIFCFFFLPIVGVCPSSILFYGTPSFFFHPLPMYYTTSICLF